MGAATEISWTDSTFNPWWGCQRVSPGCEQCYAETFAKRVGKKVWGPTAERRFFGDKHWAEPVKWNREAEAAGVRRRVFCASMADVFEDRRDLDPHRDRLWALIEATPWLDWQLLTKRPENHEMVPLAWQTGSRRPANVWFGVTAENQEYADRRIPYLLTASWPVVRFVSYEPALGPLDVSRYMWPVHSCWPSPYNSPEEAIAAGRPIQRQRQALVSAYARFVDWVVIGGESGHGARTFHVEWARAVVKQCREAGSAPFMKQLGAKPLSLTDSGLFIMRTKSAKGGDLEDIPTDLRIREFPTPRSTP